eukprot:Sspe_Gene.111763::Locus_93890_Transcript_1_1_Confidence_1.000_Length_544::g.111763::m.111763
MGCGASQTSSSAASLTPETLSSVAGHPSMKTVLTNSVECLDIDLPQADSLDSDSHVDMAAVALECEVANNKLLLGRYFYSWMFCAPSLSSALSIDAIITCSLAIEDSLVVRNAGSFTMDTCESSRVTLSDTPNRTYLFPPTVVITITTFLDLRPSITMAHVCKSWR